MEHALRLLARRCGLQVAESRLTTDRGRWSCLLLADELRRVSAQPAVDLRELFGRICFNAAVSNVDDHPRNHALLGRSTSWQLNHAYDLTLAPLQAQTRRDLAMACAKPPSAPATASGSADDGTRKRSPRDQPRSAARSACAGRQLEYDSIGRPIRRQTRGLGMLACERYQALKDWDRYQTGGFGVEA